MDKSDELRKIRAKVVSIVDAIDYLLAQNSGEAIADSVEEETNDSLAYRVSRNPNGRLSDQGERVMVRLIKLGLTDEQIGERMKVKPLGVSRFRRAYRKGRRQPPGISI